MTDASDAKADEMYIRDSLRQRLYDRRMHLCMTQRRVAELAGIYSSSYSAYECGYREPRLPILARIAEALGTTVSQLLKGIC